MLEDFFELVWKALCWVATRVAFLGISLLVLWLAYSMATK
jgi:hypothetical protein